MRAAANEQKHASCLVTIVLACSAGVFWVGETLFVLVICCSRHLWFYDSGRLGRVQIVTLTVGVRAKEEKGGGSLFFLRQCESLNWSDCLVVLLLSATHFRKSGHARLIRGCFSFSQCFRAGVFSSLFPPPPRSLWLAPSPPLLGKFQHGTFASKLSAQRKRLHCRLQYSLVSN